MRRKIKFQQKTGECMSEDNQLAKIQFRLACPEDESFIFNSWLKSYRDSDSVKHITNTVYFKRHHEKIEKLLKTSSVVCAVNPDDPRQIFGYVVFQIIDEVVCVHYIYVKQPYRGLGIARSIMRAIKPDLGQSAFVFTHLTKTGKSLYSKFMGLYDPYLGE